MVSDVSASCTPPTTPAVLILVLMEYGLWRKLFTVVRIVSLGVLILVLMEYGLWHYSCISCRCNCCVLILVLMEYGLWHYSCISCRCNCCVLILVLMEYGLWLKRYLLTQCFTEGLNPCSNGIWSLTGRSWPSTTRTKVLILVLMEYGLWPGGAGQVRQGLRS